MSSLLYELCCRVNLLQQTQQLILKKLADCWYIIFVINYIEYIMRNYSALKSIT
jgi:hypothetical protein